MASNKLKLYNTLAHEKQLFQPIGSSSKKDSSIGMYACGPTVYWFAHIGNLRAYTMEDVLKRTLEYNNYKVKHIMNITDVGHLTSDADTGEDKLQKTAKKEEKSVWDIAEFYTNEFKKDIDSLNIKVPDTWVKASDTISEQIELIKKLEEKGFTYKISDGVYFNVSKLENYGRLWKNKENKTESRIEENQEKINPNDFALWKFTREDFRKEMIWDSPWGKGFPGWHTECVVMGVKYLGIPFDIHCGGIDHIPVHHTNEIAQAEAAYGKMLANYWIHVEFLVLKEGRMGKSKGNILTLKDLIKQGFNPLAYRYLCLQAHYRSKLIFSLNALKGAQNTLENLWQKVRELKTSSARTETQELKQYQQRFLKLINDDLDTPKALALIWELIKDKNISDAEKYKLLLDFDKVLGLKLSEVEEIKVPHEIKDLIQEREDYRKAKEWKKADQIRKKIKNKGYKIEDTPKGPKVKPE